MENVVMKLTQQFWKNKRVLVTGHSGFKGSWLSLWLTSLGAKVTGISLPPTTEPNLFSLIKLEELIENTYTDIRNAEKLFKFVQKASPDIVFHLAAQPLVRASYQDPLKTFATNIMGTANLLDALKKLESVKVAVLITSDKVYQNQEWAYPYRENDILGGHDPYSSSKAAAEIIAASYRNAFLDEQGVSVATARAGNVIGGGDWAEDRLIPDAVRAWEENKVLNIRCPQAVRPWQHVLEPLAGYLVLAEKLWEEPKLAGAYNFGPETTTAATVREVIDYASTVYGNGKVKWADTKEGPHEAGLLTLDITKTKTILGVKPKWSLIESIDHTINWYLQASKGVNPHTLCVAEINEYEKL